MASDPTAVRPNEAFGQYAEGPHHRGDDQAGQHHAAEVVHRPPDEGQQRRRDAHAQDDGVPPGVGVDRHHQGAADGDGREQHDQVELAEPARH
jgi:hypothetical protein